MLGEKKYERIKNENDTKRMSGQREREGKFSRASLHLSLFKRKQNLMWNSMFSISNKLNM